MNEAEKKEISKFLSLVLRHKPEIIGLLLDDNGWADTEQLITACARHGHAFSMQELEEVVVTNDKKRFAFNDDKTRIRASQGHSVEVDLALLPQKPPAVLYHGTVDKFLLKIKEEGLKKMNRQHVHLSHEKSTAEKVGGRRGKAIILLIDSELMHKDGIVFYCSANGVWLTDEVPVKYIDFTNS